MLTDLTVSVIIPTRGRPQQVTRAIRSALGQTRPPLEVIVVVDGPDPQTEQALLMYENSQITVVSLSENVGAGAARNVGISRANGDCIAFLDDDDTWLPEKLETQILALGNHDGRPVIMGSAAYWRTGSKTYRWPTRAPRRGESVGEYLFVRDHAGEGLLATPTLLMPTRLAKSCPFPTDLSCHEEWAWFLDLERLGATFDVVMRPLAEIDARPQRISVSSLSRWRVSMTWAWRFADLLGPRAFSGFVLTEVARAAALDRAPLSHHLAIIATALCGRPRPRDIARAILRPLVARRSSSTRR